MFECTLLAVSTETLISLTFLHMAYVKTTPSVNYRLYILHLQILVTLRKLQAVRTFDYSHCPEP